MIIEFAKYKNVSGIKRVPVKGDWVIDLRGDMAKIVYYDNWSDYYHIRYYSSQNRGALGNKYNTKIDFIKYFGTKEEMITIKEAEKFNL
jgi:hypothetical protein